MSVDGPPRLWHCGLTPRGFSGPGKQEHVTAARLLSRRWRCLFAGWIGLIVQRIGNIAFAGRMPVAGTVRQAMFGAVAKSLVFARCCAKKPASAERLLFVSWRTPDGVSGV
jgi:hypothetical protein